VLASASAISLRHSHLDFPEPPPGAPPMQADMRVSTPSELKGFLLAEGFEIYRGLGDQIVLAERVRDNLIMDSGVSVLPGDPPRVQVVVRAQASDFPSDSWEALFDRARALAQEAQRRGYLEVASRTAKMRDPGDGSRTLDTWYEVQFEKAALSDDELRSELHYALGLEKAVPAEEIET
jgi:hypothetical protein